MYQGLCESGISGKRMPSSMTVNVQKEIEAAVTGIGNATRSATGIGSEIVAVAPTRDERTEVEGGQWIGTTAEIEKGGVIVPVYLQVISYIIDHQDNN